MNQYSITVFREFQTFRQWWLWLFVTFTAAPILGILLYQVITGEPVGDRPASNTVLFVLTLVIPTPIFFSFYFAKLSTIIDKTGIEYGWNLPTSDLNFLPWTDVKSVEIIKYKFIGYGFRATREYGIVYNTKGSYGLHINKNNGGKILIGTLRPEELEAYLTFIEAPLLESAY